MKTVKIELTANEVLVAGYVGMRRAADAYFKNRKVGFKEFYLGELWSSHIESAHAETAVSKYLGKYWGYGVNTFDVPDIEGTDIEVRWSRHTHDKPSKGCKVKAQEADSKIIVAVTGRCPNYEIMGWCEPSYAKRPRMYCAEFPPCYFVPFDELRPMDELKAFMKERAGNG